MPIGTVKFFNEQKGYGFIAPDGGGQDAFVHISAIERAGWGTLRENQRLSYELEQDQRGKTAAGTLRKVDEPANDSGETAEITGIADASTGDEQAAPQA
jgi:CspA family cold shock protein